MRTRIREKADGRYRYLTDVVAPGVLWASYVRSPFALAAASFPGRPDTVAGNLLLFTAADVPAVRYNSATVQRSREMDLSSDVSLLHEVARHRGDVVGLVVAESAEQARSAARDWPVAWEVLEPVVSLEQAVKVGRPAGRLSFGDPNLSKAIDEAPIQVDLGLSLARAQHVCLEPHACIAIPNEDRSTVRILTNNQAPAQVAKLVAQVLGLPPNAVEVAKFDEGGGFGNKQDIYAEALLAHVAMTIGRPVGMTFTRYEEFVGTRLRHGGWLTGRAGFGCDGRLLATTMSAVIDAGAYASHTPYVLAGIGAHLRNVYSHAEHHFEAIAYKTNTPPSGAYRGYGVGQSALLGEQLLDIAAGRLGMSPATLRAVNLRSTPVQRKMAACVDRFDSDRTAVPVIARDVRADKRLGTGLAIGVKSSATKDEEEVAASVGINNSGSLVLRTGTCDSGTGSSRALAILVAEELDVPSDDVVVIEGDSATTVMDIGSTAQRSVHVGGRVAVLAARAFRAEARARFGEVGCDVTGSHWPHLRLPEVPGCCVDLGKVDTAFFGGASLTNQEQGVSCAAMTVDVEVDADLGTVVVRAVDVVVDAGRIVDYERARGQVIGAVVQGVGLHLGESAVYRSDGRGPESMAEHGCVSAVDAPPVSVTFLESSTSPYGLGELASVPIGAAIANAVRAAVGRRPHSYPLHPSTVWRLINDARTGASS